MMNFKEKELSFQLFDTLKQQFSDIQIVEIVESPLEESSWRVRIRMPTNEDQEVELREPEGAQMDSSNPYSSTWEALQAPLSVVGTTKNA